MGKGVGLAVESVELAVAPVVDDVAQGRVQRRKEDKEERIADERCRNLAIGQAHVKQNGAEHRDFTWPPVVPANEFFYGCDGVLVLLMDIHL